MEAAEIGAGGVSNADGGGNTGGAGGGGGATGIVAATEGGVVAAGADGCDAVAALDAFKNLCLLA